MPDKYISRSDVILLRRYARRREDFPMGAAETRLCALLITAMSDGQRQSIARTLCRAGKDSLSDSHRFDGIGAMIGATPKVIDGPKGLIP